MSSSPNIINVGAVVDLGAYKAGMQDAVSTTERTMSEVSSSFERHSEKSQAAMHAMGLSAEATGVTINRHLRTVINELPVLSKAFEVAFPVFAGLAMLDLLEKAGEKLGELISKTFIFTDAMKEQDKALKESNKSLENAAERVKRLGREYAFAAEVTAIGKEKLKLAFIFEDLGGDPTKLRTKLNGVLEEFNKLSVALNQPNRFAVPDALKELGFSDESPGKRVEEAKAKLNELANQVLSLRSAISVADAESKNIGLTIKNDLSEQADKAATKFAQFAEKVKRAFEEMKRAQTELARSQQHLDEDLFREFKTAEDAQVKTAIEGIDRRVKAMLKEFEEQRAVVDAGYQGQIEAAKQASEIRQQIIEQDFIRGKINQQQEIAALAAEKERELALERLTQQKRWALWDGDVKKQREIQNQIDKLVAQSELAKTKAVTDALKAQEQQYRKVFQQIGNSFKTEVMGILEGTETIAQGFQKMYQNLIGMLADHIAQKAEKKAEEWLIEQIFGKKKAAENVAQATSNVGVAASEALASVPWPFNIAAAAETEGVGSGFISEASVAFLAQGTNYVPMDGLAFLHKGEQVIPANRQGPGFSGGGGHFHLHFAVNAIDADGVRDHLSRNKHLYSDMFFREAKKKGWGK